MAELGGGERHVLGGVHGVSKLEMFFTFVLNVGLFAITL